MTIEPALAAIAISTAAAALAGAISTRMGRELEERVAQRIKQSPGIEPSTDVDPQDLNRYLFQQAGSLSIREYAADAEVRGIVERAVLRVDELVGQPETDLPDDTDDSPQVIAARSALERGDPVAALAWLRLGIEQRLQDLAAVRGIDFGRSVGASGFLRQLAAAGVLDTRQLHDLSYAVRVANEALHEGSISTDQAREATEMASRTLREIRDIANPDQ